MNIKDIKAENKKLLASGIWPDIHSQLESSDYQGDPEALTNISYSLGRPDWYDFIDCVKPRFFSDITEFGADGYLDYSLRYSTKPLYELHIYFEHADVDTCLDSFDELIKSLSAQQSAELTIPTPTYHVPGQTAGATLTLEQGVPRAVPLKMAKGMFVANGKKILFPVLPNFPNYIASLILHGKEAHLIDPRISSIVLHTPKRSLLCRAIRAQIAARST